VRRFVFGVFLASCFVVSLCGCGAKQEIQTAEAAVGQFHEQLNAESYAQIYDASDAAMKNATPQDKFVALLDAIHRKLGWVKNSNRQTFFLNYGTNGKTVRLTYSTQFDNDRAAEEFIFRVDGKEAYLMGYHINSDALVTR
jgi:Protein of unknown function (DUF4019)